MPKTTDQILLDAIQGLRNDIARIDRDLGKDRDKTEELALEVHASTEQVKSFGRRLELIEKKIQEKMADVVAPMIESTDNLTEAIENKKLQAEKIIKVKVPKWWKFWY